MSKDNKEHNCSEARCAATPIPTQKLTERITKRSTILGGIIIAVLPKCPLCALAYSSAITMCSGTMYEHTADWTSYISIVLCALTLGLVLYNYKGYKTLTAAAMIATGGFLLGYAELVSGNVTAYYWGCAIVFVGIWINGSFQHFAAKGMGVLRKGLNKEAANA